MPGLITIPSWWHEPLWDLHCDPTALKGQGTGDGTPGNPYTDFQVALNQAKAQGKSLGVRTGRMLDVSQHVDLTTTAGIYSITAYPGLRIGAWQVDSDVPSIFVSAKLYGTNPAHWTKVSVKDGADPGTVVAVNGVYDAWQPGQPPVWQLNEAIAPSVTIAAVEIGERGRTASIITPANYKQSGIDSEGVEIGWLSDSGASNVVVNPTNGQRSRFVADGQWCHTDNGGLLVMSEQNPAERGGVYIYQQEKGILHIQECPDFSLQYAFQGQFVGKLLNVRNNNDEVMDGEIVGLAAEHYGRLFQLVTDNRTPNFGSGSTGTGSVDMTAGTNSQVFGVGEDAGTEPWLELDISHVRGYYGHGSLTALGWIRKTKIHDIELEMQSIQGQSGVFIAWSAQARMGEHNEIFDFKFRMCHNGSGRFGRLDGGVGFDGPCGGISLHHGVFETCAYTVQMGGARRNQTVYNVDFIDVLRGPYVTDELDDGNGSHTIANCRVVLSNPADWDISQHVVSAADWQKAVAYDVREEIAYPARGHALDTDMMHKNDGTLFLNNRASAGTCPPGVAYLLRNGSINAPSANGPWHSTGVLYEGGPFERAENGEPVAPGQTQVRGTEFPTIGVIAAFGFDADKIVVDYNYADAYQGGAGPQTIGQLILGDPKETLDGALTDDSPAALRTGGLALDPVLVDAPIPYVRVALNTTDRRRVPRYSRSVGSLYWVPRSTGPVDLY